VTTLSRYVVGRFLLAFLGSLLILALAVLVVDMLLYLQAILETESSAWGVIKALLMRVAAVYLPYLIPVATFTGALFAVGSAARALEILAIKAGGISPVRAMVPIFIAAALLSGLTFVLNETVTIRAAAAMRGAGGAQRGHLSIGDGTIWRHTGRFVYHIVEPDAGVADSAGITLYERNEAGRLLRAIHAREGTELGPDTWEFRAATIRTFDLADPGQPPSIEQFPEITLELKEDRPPPMLRAQLETLPVWDLANASAVNESPALLGVLHHRLTAPLSVLLFALLAVPLGLSVERTRSMATPALRGVGLLFLFLLAREYSTTLAEDSAQLAALTPWMIVLLFGAVGAVSLYRTPT